MPNQIILKWSIDVAGSSLGPVAASAAMAAIELYQDTVTDPVLGQLFGLTVGDDAMSTVGLVVTRTLSLNMSASGTPPPFPCHPRTSTPPVLPYPLRETVTLPGSFFPERGDMTVLTTVAQIPSIVPGDSIQFLSQEGVFYQVTSVGPTSIGITPAYSGTTRNTGAFKEVVAPVTRVAIYSTSPLDNAGASTTPAIPAGPGARTVLMSYKDSTGAGPFNASALLTGRRPAEFSLDGASKDVAEIENIVILAAGSFANNVGQLTVVELSEDLPDNIGSKTPEEFNGVLTDEAQLLISKHLAYLPPSYFSLAQQSASDPQLGGDFFVTTGSKNVPTDIDQTSSLSPGDQIRFVSQPRAVYTVAAVTSKLVTLTTEYTGIDDNNTGPDNVNSNIKTKGNLGTSVIRKATGTSRVFPIAAGVPTNDQLAGPLAQFVETGVAQPPPNPPLTPATVPVPTFLSNLFTRTLQKALAVPVAPGEITFA